VDVERARRIGKRLARDHAVEPLLPRRDLHQRHDAGDRLGYLAANLAWALKRDDLRPPLLALMRRLVGEPRDPPR
jgi:UTP--glucose-1-phosphate uridylyltransferase